MASINSGVVVVDFEDAQAIAQNISEYLQSEDGADRDLWLNILTRLNASIRHAE